MRWLLTVTSLIGFSGLVLTQEVQQTQVLVLGAGAAGLSAAKTLHDQGITDFIILEGSDRIGGRVKSVNFSGKTVEAGANWVTTIDEFKILSDIVSKYNIKGINKNNYDSVVIRNADGQDITDDAEGVWARLEAAKSQLMKTAKTLITTKAFPDMSVRSCLRIGGWRPKTYIDDVVEFFDIDFDYGTMPQAVSCSQEFIQDVVDDDFYVNDDRGYEFLLKKYVEDAVPSDDPRIRLNEVVNKIEHDKNKVTVTTKSGKVFNSNFAVVTFSVSVLQRKLVTFQPPLPNRFTDNLARVRQENYVKVYLKFPRKFWGDTEFILFADPAYARGYYSVWHNLEATGLFPTGTNMLRLVAPGVNGARISRLSDEEIKTETMEVLRKMYKGQTVPDPDSIYVTRWESDPLYMGTFCNMATGALQKNVTYALSVPVGKLYFAGEIYDPLMFCYVSGAMRSGIETAKKVMKCMDGVCEQYKPQNHVTPTCGSNFLGLSLFPLALSMLAMTLQ